MSPLDAGTAAWPSALERARRRLMVRRLSQFAAPWLCTTAVWTVVLIAQGLLTPWLGIALPAFQGALLALAIRVLRADPAGPRVRGIVAAVVTILGISTVVLFALVGGDRDMLAFVLLTLYLASALFFAWGWRTALGVLVATAVPWAVAIPRLQFFLPTIELVAAIGIGSSVCLAIAEVTERTFGVAFERGEREREATHALAASRDAYRDLAENASDLIYTHDLEGRLTYVNDAFARYAGLSSDALIGRTCQELMAAHPEAPDVATVIARAASGDAVPPLAIPVDGPEGLRWIECAISAIDDRGRVVGIRGIARDITARRHAEEQLRTSLAELRHSEEMLRLLARRQATIREEERKRLGFNLHDDVCQELVGIGILLASLHRRIENGSPSDAETLGQICRYLNEIVEHLRGVAHDLRPLLLRELGLEGGLRSLADGMSSPTMRVSVTCPSPIPRFDEDVEIGVYRIAQEALANAGRHAGARTIALTLTLNRATLQLEVRDNGCGFATRERRKPRLGLIGMQERALALGGRVAIDSEPGKGTTVHLECPLRARIHAVGS